MTESNQGPATPGTAARCEDCGRPKAQKEELLGANVDGDHGIHCWKDLYAGEWHLTECLRLGFERLKAENASLLEGKERGHRINEKQKAAIAAAEQRAEAAEKRSADLDGLAATMAERTFEGRCACGERVFVGNGTIESHKDRNANPCIGGRSPWREVCRLPLAPIARAALHDEERSAPQQWMGRDYSEEERDKFRHGLHLCSSRCWCRTGQHFTVCTDAAQGEEK